MIQNGKPDPIQWPTVTIGGKAHTLRFTGLQVMLFQERQLKLSEMSEAGEIVPKNRLTLRDVCDLLAIYLSTTKKLYTAEEVAEMIDPADVKATMDAAVVAMGKVKRPETKAPPASPAEQTSSATGLN